MGFSVSKRDGLNCFTKCIFSANGSQILLSDYAQSIDGEFITNVQQLAKELSTAIVIGSFIESDLDHVYNTSVFIDEMGQILGTYRKMHLFDVTVDGHTIQESKTFTREGPLYR